MGLGPGSWGAGASFFARACAARTARASFALCSWESTSAGPSPTRSLLDGERAVHGEGADDARRPVARGARGDRARRSSAPAPSAGDVERLRPRDDGRHQRAARGARRAHGPDRHRAASPTCSRSAARTAPASTASARRRPAPLVAADDCASRPPSGSAPTAWSRRSPTPSSSGWSSEVARRRRRVGRDLPAVLLPRPRARAARSPSACASELPERARLGLARGAGPRSASTSAARRP